MPDALIAAGIYALVFLVAGVAVYLSETWE
jgi:hypothetical protein